MPSDNEAEQAEERSPEMVKTRFRTYKRLLIKLVGRGPMDDAKINRIGEAEFGTRWAGVHPSDRAKKLLRMRDRFAVVNTATSKGRGSHWLGVYMTAKGEGYVYDSFGRDIDRVMWQLSRAAVAANNVLHETDPAAEQRGTSAVCGQLSLSWLLTVRDLGVRATASAI
jgi:hypothetical protein